MQIDGRKSQRINESTASQVLSERSARFSDPDRPCCQSQEACVQRLNLDACLLPFGCLFVAVDCRVLQPGAAEDGPRRDASWVFASCPSDTQDIPGNLRSGLQLAWGLVIPTVCTSTGWGYHLSSQRGREGNRKERERERARESEREREKKEKKSPPLSAV